MTEKPRIRVGSDGAYRLDAWRNGVSGMGVPGVDPSGYTKFDFAGAKIDWRTLSMMYRYDWLARKICDRPAQDAVRRWITLDDKKLLAEMERLGAKKRIKQAIAWGRLYGGAAILIVADDGMSSADPLNPAKIKSLIDLKATDRYNLTPVGRIESALDIGYGEPEFYTTNNGTIFHHSRVLKFNGADLTIDEQQQEQHWGGSYVEMYQQAIKHFQGSMQDVRHIMTESSVGMLQIPGLTNSVAMGGTIFDSIQKRLDQFNLSKSLYRTAAMDAEETFDYKQRQLTGLSDLMDRFMTQVAGATDMGELVLFGTSPSGLNASQAEQMAMYYDSVRNIQEGDQMPAINTILSCLTRGAVPEWEYAPLMEPSDKDKAEIRKAEAEAIAVVADPGLLSPETIIQHLNDTGHFNLQTGGRLEDFDLDNIQ